MLKRIFAWLPPAVKSFYRNASKKLSEKAVFWLSQSLDEWKPDPRVNIGKYTYGIRKSTIPLLTSATRINVGKYCSVGPGVVFVVGRHPIENVSTYPFRARFVEGGKFEDEMASAEFISIGNDVWFGSRAMIVANVKIGHGAVIAAGSVVYRSVPPYAIVGGVPAKIIRRRFNPEQVQKLLKMAWWDWPEERIAANIDLFYRAPDEFIRKHYAD